MSEPETTNYFASRLKSDGERFLPGVMEGVIALEHNHRYRFASQLVAGNDVLDIASGEGYGSAWLARHAKSVIGVDISPDAVAHAKARYAADNLEYRVGSCSAIPLGTETVDVVVSFETIEHLREHEEMMREVKRVLRPGGVLVISSPDKFEYSDKPRFQNPFHVRELYRSEFSALLSQHFRNIAVYGQRVLFGSVVFPEQSATSLSFERLGGLHDATSLQLPAPLYILAIASDSPLPASVGGILEPPEGEPLPARDTRQDPLATTLIRAIAAPNSRVLSDRLRSRWYLDRNADLVSVSDTTDHWERYGHVEGRSPAKDLVALAKELVNEREQQAWQAHASSAAMLTTTLGTALANANTAIERERALTERFAAAGELAARERVALTQDLRVQFTELSAVRHQLTVELRSNVERESEVRSLRATVDAQGRTLSKRTTALQEQLKVAHAELQSQCDQHTREALQQSERERALIARIEAAEFSARQHLAALASQRAQHTLEAMRQSERERALVARIEAAESAARQNLAALVSSHDAVLNEIGRATQAFRASWAWRSAAPLRGLGRVFGLRSTPVPQIPSSTHPGAPSAGKSSQPMIVDAATPLNPASAFSGALPVPAPRPSSRTAPVTAARSLGELLRLSGGSFVACAYMTLLRRAPDREGYAYYVDRLDGGLDRMSILYEMYISAEARRFDGHVAGLKPAMARQRLRRLPIIGLVLRWIRPVAATDVLGSQ